jgi:hypothetical protein
MLRRMSHPRRAVSRLLSLSCAVAVGAAPLTACQQIQELTGGKKEEPPVATPDTKTTTPPPVAQPVVPPPAIEVPEASLPHGTLDALLALVHADAPGPYFVVRHAGVILDYGDSAVKFFEAPAQALKPMMGPGAADFDANFAKFKAGLAEARAKLTGSGVDLSKGAVITQTGTGSDVDGHHRLGGQAGGGQGPARRVQAAGRREDDLQVAGRRVRRVRRHRLGADGLQEG